jgi:mannose-6-phosphate isomerase-like protein (cupin superfamily)
MESGTVELNEGEMFVVPRGVRHNPIAEEECHILLIEKNTTLHTGDVKTEKPGHSQSNCGQYEQTDPPAA